MPRGNPFLDSFGLSRRDGRLLAAITFVLGALLVAFALCTGNVRCAAVLAGVTAGLVAILYGLSGGGSAPGIGRFRLKNDNPEKPSDPGNPDDPQRRDVTQAELMLKDVAGNWFVHPFPGVPLPPQQEGSVDFPLPPTGVACVQVLVHYAPDRASPPQSPSVVQAVPTPPEVTGVDCTLHPDGSSALTLTYPQ